MAKRLVGELNGMYGKQHSEETRRKISEANKGQDNVRSMAIQCVETGVIYKVCQSHERTWYIYKRHKTCR